MPHRKPFESHEGQVILGNKKEAWEPRFALYLNWGPAWNAIRTKAEQNSLYFPSINLTVA